MKFIRGCDYFIQAAILHFAVVLLCFFAFTAVPVLAIEACANGATCLNGTCVLTDNVRGFCCVH